jgi:hypothetical protein
MGNLRLHLTARPRRVPLASLHRRSIQGALPVQPDSPERPVNGQVRHGSNHPVESRPKVIAASSSRWNLFFTTASHFPG